VAQPADAACAAGQLAYAAALTISL